MRKNLVTVFNCAECGDALELVYEKGKQTPRGMPLEDNSPHNITGADKVVEHILIKPCEKCLSPLRSIKESIKTLVAVVGSDGKVA